MDVNLSSGHPKETATFAAGCFWGVEESFRHVRGVLGTTVGYTGGTTLNPRYQDVCTGMTGHAEAVEVTFDPAVVSYRALLTTFFSIHDPTQKDRQGPDIGSQYRSAIFYHSSLQEAEAREMISVLSGSGRFRTPIMTEVVPAPRFWPAEEYHQRYIQKRGGHTCHW